MLGSVLTAELVLAILAPLGGAAAARGAEVTAILLVRPSPCLPASPRRALLCPRFPPPHHRPQRC